MGRAAPRVPTVPATAIALSAAILLVVFPAPAQDIAEFSFDTAVTRLPVKGLVLLVNDEQPTGIDVRTGAYVRTLPGLPDGSDLVALHRDPSLQLTWFALDTTVLLPSAAGPLLVRPRDLAVYDEASATYSIAIAAEALGIPDGIGIDAVAQDPADGNHLLSFDGWFESAGQLRRPDALYRYDALAGTYGAVSAFDPVAAMLGNGLAPNQGMNLNLVDAPSTGVHAGELLLGFDVWLTAGPAFNFPDLDVVIVDPDSSVVLGAISYDPDVAEFGNEFDRDALWTGDLSDSLFSDGFEN